MGSYVPHTAAQREEMLAAIGVKTMDELYRDVPQEMLLNGSLQLPEGMSELEVRQAVTALAAVLGTIPPTRRLLKEPVTEGLRRDTD